MALPVIIALCLFQQTYSTGPTSFYLWRHRILLIGLLGSILVLNYPVFKQSFTYKDFNKNVPWEKYFSVMDPPEYTPRQVENTWELYEQYSKIPQVMILKGNGSVTIDAWKSRKIRIITNGITPLTLLIKQYYYSGWTAEIGGKNELPIKKVKGNLINPDGLIQLQVPAGNQHITLRLERGFQEKTGSAISLLTTTFLIACLMHSLYKRLSKEYLRK
jgi:hypothetical protein